MSVLKGLVTQMVGTKHDRDMKRMRPVVSRINELEPRMMALSNEELRAFTPAFLQRHEQGESLDELLPEAFAVVREMSRRVLGMRHFDVQLLGGIVLHEGKIAEMKTGEGKTLVATLPCYLNALSRKGVHVITVNDYLAKRDAEWMGRVHKALGLSVGCVVRDLTNEERREAYAADITYGTNSEMGFDYLRDNMKLRFEDFVQRGHNYSIVDEVDSILIDEARTPLIISGQSEGGVELYRTVDRIVPTLQAEIDYTVDLKSKTVSLTDEGVEQVEKRLGLDNLFDLKNVETFHALSQALRAHVLYRRDVEYVVRSGQVIIVDEFTGRLMPGRRWSDGLHQAIEAKEKVEIEPENRTVATITYQNFFLLYDKLAGMTGTADTEAAEFSKIYELDVVVVPTNMPMIREDYPDVVYKTEAEKFEAVVDEIEQLHNDGRPILVGTVSVEKSEIISRMLKRKKIPHNVLNAKNHAREAEIVAQAGHSGEITIATNMAGRGTDIVLGGNPEFQAQAKVGPDVPIDDPAYQDALKEAREAWATDREKVVRVGGLHILGTERHDSRRIDNQLRGRSGRQGDPGSSRFYLSLEDNLMKAFGSERISSMMDRFGYEEGVPIEHPWLTKAIENAQKKLEGYHFGIRKNLKEYDDVLNQQRQVFYKIRSQVLRGERTRELVIESIESLVGDIFDAACPERKGVEEWDFEAIRDSFNKVFGVIPEIDVDNLPYAEKPREELEHFLCDLAVEQYGKREEEIGEELMRRIEREILLKTMDRLWMDHLSAIDHLRDSVRLRGIGQRDPLLEYKKEGYNMFQEMLALRDEQVVDQLFKIRRATQEDVLKLEAQRRLAMRLVELGGGSSPQVSPVGDRGGAPGAPGQARAGTGGRPARLPGRNQVCWCGSGKKYKKCHMAEDLAEANRRRRGAAAGE